MKNHKFIGHGHLCGAQGFGQELDDFCQACSNPNCITCGEPWSNPVHRFDAVKELIKIAEEMLARLPSDEIIEDIMSDAGLGYRNYPMSPTPSDEDIVRWRKVVSRAKEEK